MMARMSFMTAEGWEKKRPAGAGGPRLASGSLTPSVEQEARLPAHPLGAGPQLFQGPVLDLADPLFANSQQVPDLPQAVRAAAGQAEPQVQHLLFPRPQVVHQEPEGLLALVVRLGDGAGVVRH